MAIESRRASSPDFVHAFLVLQAAAEVVRRDDRGAILRVAMQSGEVLWSKDCDQSIERIPYQALNGATKARHARGIAVQPRDSLDGSR